MSWGDLTDAEWHILDPLLPDRGERGPSVPDKWRTLNGILWVLRTGAPWRDIPERYGNLNSVFVRFSLWSKLGVWDAVFETLASLGPPADKEHAIDSTIVRAHQYPVGSKIGKRSAARAAVSRQKSTSAQTPKVTRNVRNFYLVAITLRFQQSRFRPYDRDCSVLPPKKIRSFNRRLWRIRPRTTLFVIGGLILAGVVTDRAWLRGNGIVAGELVAVSPIVQARLQRLFVRCLDQVARGQRVAEFVNEATLDLAAQQLQQLQLQLSQARAAIEIAQRQADAAFKLVEAQEALLQQQIAIFKAQDQLMKKNYVAVLVWEQAQAAVKRADAETRAAEFVYQTQKASQKKAELDAEVLQKRIDSFMNSPELTGHFYLTAPKDGVVTQCTHRPGEVVDARSPIFSIFNPDDAFAVAFFSSGDRGRLSRGQSFNISIEGIDEPLIGTVTDFYPEHSALPSSLTRYFWQREMWSQYVPVRLDFSNLNATKRSKIFAWAQLSASRWDGQWIRKHLSWAREFVTASFAQWHMNR